MRIETYSDRYLQEVINLVENFHKEAVGEYDNVFDPNCLIETIKSQKENSDNAFLLIIDDVCQGILFGSRFKSLINDGLIFQEIIWYVNKPFRKYGVYLLRECEKLLKSSGISIMIMAVLENSKTEKLKAFYQRLGFKPMETHLVRSL